MKQFTITYRDKFGVKFAFVSADSVAEARAEISKRSPDAAILTVRENNPPLATVEAWPMTVREAVLMNSADVVGYTLDGEFYCLECGKSLDSFAVASRDEPAAVFAGDEYDSAPVCTVCGETCEDVTLLHEEDDDDLDDEIDDDEIDYGRHNDA